MSAKAGKGRMSETYTECASMGFIENYPKPQTQQILVGDSRNFSTRYSSPRVMAASELGSRILWTYLAPPKPRRFGVLSFADAYQAKARAHP